MAMIPIPTLIPEKTGIITPLIGIQYLFIDGAAWPRLTREMRRQVRRGERCERPSIDATGAGKTSKGRGGRHLRSKAW